MSVIKGLTLAGAEGFDYSRFIAGVGSGIEQEGYNAGYVTPDMGMPSFALMFEDLGGGAVNTKPIVGAVAATFTRAGATATTIGRTGLVIPAIGANIARAYYDPTTLQYQGYLPEGARTNLMGRSEELSNVTWVKSNTTVTADAIISPDGTLTADKIVEAATNTIHNVQQGAVGTNGLAYTVSAFLKVGERNFVVLDMTDSLTGGAYAYFNLSTGIISQAATTSGSWTAASATIKAYPNGWYRCTVTATLGANNSVSPLIGISNVGTGGEAPSYAGDGTSGLYAWGLQLEQASFASSYIPTTVATVTRNADVLTYPFTANSGTFFMQAMPLSASGALGMVLQADDGSANNEIQVYREAANTFQVFVTSGGATQVNQSSGAFAVNASSKFAVAVATNDEASSANGAAVVTDTSVTLPVAPLTTLRVGNAAGLQLFGTISRIAYFPPRLPDYILRQLTS